MFKLDEFECEIIRFLVYPSCMLVLPYEISDVGPYFFGLFSVCVPV
jgi:hypothetical protein